MTVNELAKALQQKLENGLPGQKAHDAMAADRPGPDSPAPQQPPEGVVAVMGFPEGDAFKLLLTARAENQNPLQGGTIGFSGIRYDAQQQTVEQAACEALLQEVGVPPDQLMTIGGLTSLYIPSSRIHVYPYLLLAEDTPEFQPDQQYVQEVIPIPFTSLFEDQHWQTMEVPLADGRTTKSAFFNFKGARIWGPTAMILNEVIQLLGPLRVFHHTSNTTRAN
jgi:hypothetical protein